jgi:hypothetical protein
MNEEVSAEVLMKLACNHCHRQYDEETQSMTCPHNPFPKMCEKHERFNCDSPECLKEERVIDFERKRA